MNLIDILVEELPKRGGWPEGVIKISSTSCGRVFFDGQSPHGFTLPVASDAWDSHKHPFSYTNAVTREQYEAALAAKNEGWIEWGGGECPVDASEMVDVIFGHGGRMSTNIADCWRWNHEGTDSDIIAYRLHQPQEAVQPKADDEADLNECIGQGAAPVWSGEGLPPVGVECECSWCGDEWQPCKILFASNQIVVVKLKESGIDDAYNTGDVTFRPIRTEAELKRDAAVEAIDRYMPEFIPDTPNDYYNAKKIYDAIAAGKIPGVKLED